MYLNVLKNFALFLVVVILPCSTFAQYNEWTWMKGSNTTNATAVLGTQGVPNIANTPGAAYESAEWTDNNGIFWLLTEYGYFWKYDPATNMWTWMDNRGVSWGVQGIPSVNNYPGGHGFGALTWTDNNNNLWVYAGVQSGWDGNLWRYNIGTADWTWMKGPGNCSCFAPVYGVKGVAAPTNEPGTRAEVSCSWKDAAGNLWFFGGQACNGSCNGASTNGGLSDVWKFDVGTNEWTWMSGPNTSFQPAVYGTKGVGSTTNTPGGRFVYASGKQLNGEFLLFGGNADYPANELNDVWKYNSTTDQWTWLAGPNAQNQPAVYGTKCVEAAANVPGSGREVRIRWTDDCGNLWVFGTGPHSTMVNDLWRYSIATGRWTWVSGTNLPNQTGTYGTMGVSSPTNVPGARKGGSPWRTATHFYMFGGTSGSLLNSINDLWRYRPDKPTAGFTPSASTGCAPVTVNFTNTSTPGCNEIKSYLWNFGGGVNDTSTLINPSHTYSTNGIFTVSLLVINCTGSKDSITQSLTIGSIVASVSTTTASCTGNNATATITPSSGTSPFTYNWNNGQTTSIATGLAAGNYSATVTDASGCSITQTVTISSNSTLSVTVSSTQAGCTGNFGTATANASGGTNPLTYVWDNGQSTSVATGLAPGNYTATITDGAGCTITQTVSVTSSSTFSITVSATQAACASSNGTATANASGGTNPLTYSWDNGQNSQTATGLTAGSYSATVTDANGCTQMQTVSVTQTPGPSVTAAASPTLIAPGASTTLSATGSGTYAWSPSNGLSCSTCANSDAAPGSTTIYCVTVTDAGGCSDSACVKILVELDCAAEQLYIPNAFSPNNDGENDLFQVYFGSLDCIHTVSFIIYNRWGEKVFSATGGPASGWGTLTWDGTYRGKPERTAVFTFHLHAVLTTGEEISRTGNISLLK